MSRAIGAAIVAKKRGPSRQALMRRQLVAAGIPEYASDLSMRRGRCFKCKGRYSVQRVTFDYTSAKAVEPFAHVECAKCGHVWYRTAIPALGQYQSVRLTLILPSVQRRWYARGRWHVEGEDAITLRDATWGDLMDAAAEWRKRNTRYDLARARAKAKKEAASLAAHQRAQELLAVLHAKDEARAAEEAEAAAREVN